MKVVKFNINEEHYEEFKSICEDQGVPVKRKLNFLLAGDVKKCDINEYFPVEHDKSVRKITLKINEEFYKSIMKNCGRFDYKPNRYLAYLVYKFLLENK